MKKRIFAIVLVFSLLFMSTGSVYAQGENIFPRSAVALNYYFLDMVQENVLTYEYIVGYYLPFPLSDDIADNDYFLVYKNPDRILRGEIRRNTNSYKFHSKVISGETTFIYFTVTILKSLVNDLYIDDVAVFFEYDSVMYLNYEFREPVNVMKNFLLAEPDFENGFLQEIGLEKYYMYMGASVYLPDGDKADLASMPDYLNGYFGEKPDLFEGYDFVAIAFNLSPRAMFQSPSLYPIDYITGLSYIVYDLIAETTTFYDYQGNIVYQKNKFMYIDNPMIYIPEAEAMEYQLKKAYEEGKTAGYKQGRDEGYMEAWRVIEEETRKAYDEGYRRGRNEADFENLDMFGYLQALFGEQGLGRLLKLELLPGVSLGAVIMIPLAFWIVSFIMRWFR